MHQICLGQTPLRCLVADRSEAGRICSELELGLSSSVMEFGLDQLRTGLRPGSSYLDMSR